MCLFSAFLKCDQFSWVGYKEEIKKSGCFTTFDVTVQRKLQALTMKFLYCWIITLIEEGHIPKFLF